MVTPKAMADGQLAGSKTAIYTCPSGVVAIVNLITLCNTENATPRTVNLYVNRTGTSRKIIAEDMSMAAKSGFIFNGPIVLEEADILEGDASAANVIDFQVSGVEVSAV